MSHKCLKCGKSYEEKDPVVLSGCKCGSKYFVYIRTVNDIKRMEAIGKKLKGEKTSLEKIIEAEILSFKEARKFPLETIRMPEEGIYEINVNALMARKPLVILEKERTYLIHLPSVFEKVRARG